VKSFYGTIHIARHAYRPTRLAVKTKAAPFSKIQTSKPKFQKNLKLNIQNLELFCKDTAFLHV